MTTMQDVQNFAGWASPGAQPSEQSSGAASPRLLPGRVTPGQSGPPSRLDKPLDHLLAADRAIRDLAVGPEDVTAVLDARGVIVSVSSNCKDVLGFEREELIGVAQDLLHPGRSPHRLRRPRRHSRRV